MAKRFSFRLEPLLKLRAYKTSEAKDDLNRVLVLRIDRENKITEKSDYFVTLLKRDVKSTTARDFQAMYYHKAFINDEIKQLENEKTQIMEIETIKRQVLTEAMKDEKILEKLKERKKDAYKEDLKKEEMEFLDEISIRRHGINNE